jgi:capsular polysaccharide export protein
MPPPSEVFEMPLPQTLYAVGFSRWKRAPLRAFVPESQIHFRNTQATVPEGATLLLWGQTPCLQPARHRVIRVEDGFLRSVGLGADLIAPLSYCFDRSGLYYDARHPSDLETLLQNSEFSPALLDRAQALRARLVELGLTKYNVGAETWQRPATEREVILVPGQVESDASIQLGCGSLRSNLGLLTSVRAQHPQAYIVYKPHPDVIAGLRHWGEAEREEAHVHCDALVADVPMHDLLREVDSVCQTAFKNDQVTASNFDQG